eukprot:TRINITY_DN74094_c0_g1_i1.p1 TRINITY_DN74094_c0_g1~~TRINITY_DN74094_c0_g1_i1.p1  ORF type:complete len:449 (-),score=88.63 TRINITY_DN74094_c0_g1_i1:78-1424(-)
MPVASTETTNFYELLGLERTAGAGDVRQAYKRAALRWHPDKNPNDRPRAEETFKRVAEAYATLSDPQRRAAYDAEISRPTAAPPAASGASKSARSDAPASGPSTATRSSGASVGSNGGDACRVPAAGGRHVYVNGERMPSAAAADLEAAYSLFEEIFGGRDPFQDFDAVFQDPTLARLDKFFEDLFPSKRGARKSRGAAAAANAAVAPAAPASPLSAAAPVAPAPPGEPRQAAVRDGAAGSCEVGCQVRCISPSGVAYRRWRHLDDRINQVQGPGFCDVLPVLQQSGEWVRAAGGWLPLHNASGERLFDVLRPAQVRIRCISKIGVAYRRSPVLEDRLDGGPRGPEYGEELVVYELSARNGWARTSGGWLPLFIAGERVFEVFDAPLDRGSLVGVIGAVLGTALPSSRSLMLWSALGVGGCLGLRFSLAIVRGWWWFVCPWPLRRWFT